MMKFYLKPEFPLNQITICSYRKCSITIIRQKPIMNASDENKRVKKQDQELNDQLSDTQSQLAEVQARVAVQQLDKVLQKEVQDLKVLVDSKKKMYELINSNDKLKSRGYAGFMHGLADKIHISRDDILFNCVCF